MDRQLSDAVNDGPRCRQFAAPIGPLHDDVIVPSLQVPFWSYTPPQAYQHFGSRSIWQPSENRRTEFNGDAFSQSGYQYGEINNPLSHWQQPTSSSTLVSDAANPFRTVLPHVICDRVKSSNVCDELNSGTTQHTPCCHPSPITSDFSAFADADLQFSSTGNCTHQCQDMPTIVGSRQTADCCPTSLICDPLDSIDSDEQSLLQSECPTAYRIFPEDMFNSHSVHCAPSYLTEESTREGCDVHCALAAGLHHQRCFYHPHQQHVFGDCHKTSVKAYSVNSRRSPSTAQQSASMNDLDEIDMPQHNASTVNSPPIITSSESTGSCFRLDTGNVAARKCDTALLHPQKIEREMDRVDDCEFSCEPASKTFVQSSVEGDASGLPSSCCSKQSLLSRKSKKKLLRATSEKLPPAVSQETDCDNSAAFDDAVENGLYARATDRAHRTAHVNDESDSDCTAEKSRNWKKFLHKENKKPESLGTTIEHEDLFCSDSVEVDKPNHSSVLHSHATSRVGKEMPSSVRHNRRSQQKPPRSVGAKQKSTKRADHEQPWTATGFRHLKQFLASVDWHQHHQNIGPFFTVP